MTFRIQPHVRLQEWVAEEHGYFREAGLDYEFVPSLAGSSVTTSSVRTTNEAPAELASGAFEDMQKGRSCDVSAACHWAVNAAATVRGGKMWGKAYSVCPSGIFVAPESGYQRPEDLAGIQVGVGYHSGSHYSAIQSLEPYLDKSQIELSFVGLPYDRVRLMLDGKVPAVNVFGAQYYVLEQQGFRKLVDTTFMMGFLVSEDTSEQDVEKYFGALRHAQRDIDLEPGRYKHYWLREMPQDIQRLVDVRRFGPGERIVSEPYTRETFEQTHRWMQAWNLFDPAKVARPDYDGAVLG
jgi:ABC-type nitrate/sulfonate/bicarbonate transport system substrate-binding protein